MTIFELMGKIVIENGQANKAIDDTNDKAQSLANSLNGSGSGTVSGMAQTMGSKVATAASKVGTTVANAAKVVGKTVLTGTATAAAGITALTKEAVSAYADHEQLVGGVETLFKESADTVKGYADEAFQTAGLSANEYMETVTSFSASLLQSLDGNTAAAADMANQAIIDMSDNANKMGTDMSMIQNAYQGFAKQNYTMLDNLKLGYGGTQTEMYRLLQDAKALDETFDAEFSIDSKGHLEAEFADIVEAIHIVQDEMGITGTTATEASTTISGSWGSLKGAFQNLLVGFASEDADLGGLMGNLGDTAGTFASNLIPRIVEAFGGIKDAIPELTESLAPALSEGLSGALEMVGIEIPPEKITNFFSTAFEKVGDIGQALGGAGGKVGTALKNAFQDICDSLGDEGIEVDGLVDGIFNGITKGIENAGDWAAGVVETLGGMISENMPTLLEIKDNTTSILKPITDRIKTEFSEIDWQGMFGGAAQIVASITGAVSDFVNADSDTALGKIRDFLGEIAMLPVNAISGIATAVEDIGAAFKVMEEIDAGKIDMSKALSNAAQSFETDGKTLTERADSLTQQLQGLLDDIDMGSPSFENAVLAAAGAVDRIVALFSGALDEVAKDIANVSSQITDLSTGVTVNKGKQNAKLTGNINDDAAAALKDINAERSANGALVFSGSTSTGTVVNVDDPYGVMNLNADGAIYSKATIFGRANGKLQVAGEAGAEAVAPIDVLQGYVSNAVAEQLITPTAAAAEATAESTAVIVETLRSEFDRLIDALSTIGIKINGREFGRLVNGGAY